MIIAIIIVSNKCVSKSACMCRILSWPADEEELGVGVCYHYYRNNNKKNNYNVMHNNNNNNNKQKIYINIRCRVCQQKYKFTFNVNNNFHNKYYYLLLLIII